MLDIEDLAKVGKEMHACPYYASRKAVAGADLIAVPYSMVLSSTTRDSVGLDLTNAVVIFDEAHNLIDAISSAHSAAISPSQLAAAADQLQQYIQRYKARLRGSNLFYCQQLLRLLTAVAAFLTTRTDKSATLLGVAAFFAQCDVSELNTFKLARFLSDQGLSRKVCLTVLTLLRIKLSHRTRAAAWFCQQAGLHHRGGCRRWCHGQRRGVAVVCHGPGPEWSHHC